MELTSRLGEYGNDGSVGGADCAEENEAKAMAINGKQAMSVFFIGVFGSGT